ncbi:MAG: hypothetical protein LBV14_11405 [Acidovorax sp.]|jgi:hypothetical protein|nr:hypothetical protein [Acidovorax sp.]
MSARHPLFAIPANANSLPPITGSELRFQVTVEGVTLDTLLSYGDDFDMEVTAIWHRGVDVAKLLERGIDESILDAWDRHRKAWNEDLAIDRRIQANGG